LSISSTKCPISFWNVSLSIMNPTSDTKCNEFAGSLFSMELYYTQNSIHNHWLQFTTSLEF
jgi:hypothetical protein